MRRGGERRSIDPLVRMLQTDELTGAARGFAAVALGLIGTGTAALELEDLASTSTTAASTETLTNQGKGILDIL